MKKKEKFGFVRVAALSPVVTLGDIQKTVREIERQARIFASNGTRLIVFPELNLAGGYTNADLLHQDIVQAEVLEVIVPGGRDGHMAAPFPR